MKKIIWISIFMLCACSKEDENIEKDSSVYIDGVYTTIAEGYGGDFEVTTTIENDQIKDIVVTDHNETPSIGGIAIEAIITEIKEDNENVDVISGATKTSMAIKEAVDEALNNARRNEDM